MDDVNEQRWQALKDARDLSEYLGDVILEQALDNLLHLIAERNPRVKHAKKRELKPLPEADESVDGLHKKYIISKANGTPVDESAEYFVLRLDENGDPKHVAACRDAIIASAISIEEYLPELSKDLIDRYLV